jgi:hypothetical protein
MAQKMPKIVVIICIFGYIRPAMQGLYKKPEGGAYSLRGNGFLLF